MFRRKIKRTVKKYDTVNFNWNIITIVLQSFLCNSCISQLPSSVTVKIAQMFHVKHQ